MAPELSGALIGAIGGAIVAGAIAWVLQAQSLAAQRQLITDKQAEHQRALAHSLIHKLMKISSDISNLHAHVEDSLERSDQVQMWAAVQGIANIPNEVTLTADELWLLTDTKGTVLFTEAFEVEGIHRAYVKILDHYSVRRLELGDMVPGMSTPHGPNSDLLVDESHRQVLEPRMVELNSILTDIVEDGQAQEDRAATLLFRATDHLKESLDVKIVLQAKAQAASVSESNGSESS